MDNGLPCNLSAGSVVFVDPATSSFRRVRDVPATGNARDTSNHSRIVGIVDASGEVVTCGIADIGKHCFSAGDRLYVAEDGDLVNRIPSTQRRLSVIARVATVLPDLRIVVNIQPPVGY